MELTTRHIGAHGGFPARIIELTASDGNATITEDITDLNRKVDENFIMGLRELADELEEHNQKLNED